MNENVLAYATCYIGGLIGYEAYASVLDGAFLEDAENGLLLEFEYTGHDKRSLLEKVNEAFSGHYGTVVVRDFARCIFLIARGELEKNQKPFQDTAWFCFETWTFASKMCDFPLQWEETPYIFLNIISDNPYAESDAHRLEEALELFDEALDTLADEEER